MNEVRALVSLRETRWKDPCFKTAFTAVKLSTLVSSSLLVFSMNGPKQNARSLLTPVSHGPAFYALSHASLHFVVHGSFNNYSRLSKSLKILVRNSVKSDLAFSLGSLIEKTNSEISIAQTETTVAACADFPPDERRVRRLYRNPETGPRGDG